MNLRPYKVGRCYTMRIGGRDRPVFLVSIMPVDPYRQKVLAVVRDTKGRRFRVLPTRLAVRP